MNRHRYHSFSKCTVLYISERLWRETFLQTFQKWKLWLKRKRTTRMNKNCETQWSFLMQNSWNLRAAAAMMQNPLNWPDQFKVKGRAGEDSVILTIYCHHSETYRNVSKCSSIKILWIYTLYLSVNFTVFRASVKQLY